MQTSRDDGERHTCCNSQQADCPSHVPIWADVSGFNLTKAIIRNLNRGCAKLTNLLKLVVGPPAAREHA
jgi:hypothetical protein